MASSSVLSMFFSLLVAASLVSVCQATPAEGRTLVSIASQWMQVSFPSWKAGTDPCVNLWENVSCNSAGFVTYLNVSNRGIVGSLPSQIGDLVHLEVLDIGNVGGETGRNASIYPHRNAFSGEIPASLANLTSLRALNMSGSSWDMPFPKVVTQLANLEEFQMSEASLSMEVPAELFQLKKLRILYIGSNQLYANLKDFAALTTLTELVLWGNKFNQTIPPEIAKLTGLTYLNLHDSALFGGLPDEMGNMQKLTDLRLYSNTLTGRIPDTWRNLKNLTNLRMDALFLFDLFPSWILTDLPKLDSLYLTDNLFYGNMPSAQLLDNFKLVRIDCNYMNGSDPFPNPSNQNRTRYNCFTGASSADLDKVVSKCGVSHNNLKCPMLYASVESGKCPPCPKDQFPAKQKLATNPCVCLYGGGPRSDDSRLTTDVVVGVVIGLLAVFTIIVGIILWKRREHFSFLDRFRVPQKQEYGEWEVPPGVQRFTTEELSRITENFSDSHVVGVGGFGKVFYGTLDDGRKVAIKSASATSLQGVGEFRNEIMLLSRLHHRHLVKLEGFCEEGDAQILVYEFMTKGNLHSHLLGKITSTPLHWYKRLEIAVGVAQGLEYLHSFADPPVIHRDVKPSNILLDDNMVAKLADFGISKATAMFDTHVSTRPAGTAGYLDPEYFLRRQLTTASDVYAFGVVLLELITGQEAIDHKREEEFNLIEWTRKRFRSRGILSIIDPLIEYEYSKEAYTGMTELALKCTLFNKDERPNMKEVLASLEPHLAIHSLYTSHVAASETEKGEGPSRSGERGGRPNRGVHITFESEYLETSVPSNGNLDATSLVPR